MQFILRPLIGPDIKWSGPRPLNEVPPPPIFHEPKFTKKSPKQIKRMKKDFFYLFFYFFIFYCCYCIGWESQCLLCAGFKRILVFYKKCPVQRVEESRESSTSLTEDGQTDRSSCVSYWTPRHAFTIRDSPSGYKIDCFTPALNTLNPKGQPNLFTGSKIMATLRNWLIFTVVQVSSGRVCAKPAKQAGYNSNPYEKPIAFSH